MKYALFICSMLFSASVFAQANQGRVIEVAPFSMISTHGDIICLDPFGTNQPKGTVGGCNLYIDNASADLISAQSEIGGRGVVQANHKVEISFTNLSTVNQTIGVELKTGSSFAGGFDIPNAATTINAYTRTTAAITNGVQLPMNMPDFVLAPGASGRVTWYSVCSTVTRRCCMEMNSNGTPLTSCNAHNEYPAGIQAVHIYQDSLWAFRIRVRESRGAVSATLSTFVHRHNGRKDKTNGDYNAMINGGRPF